MGPRLAVRSWRPAPCSAEGFGQFGHQRPNLTVLSTILVDDSALPGISTVRAARAQDDSARSKALTKELAELTMADQQSKLSLVQAQLGPMANFIYIIADPATRKAAVVDPAWDVDRIIDYTNSK